MKVIKILLIIFLSVGFSELKSDEKTEALKNKILKNVRCLICQGQSVYDSESDFASSIKLVIDRKIKEGLSEDAIYEFLEGKYGEWILYNPRLKKNTYILWILPLLLFLVGGVIVFKKLNIQKLRL
jgi:cytochrome c-type biogenesis protein CcmH